MILTLRITDEQQERWRGKAEGEGLSLSDWVRRACESAANGGNGTSLPAKQVEEVKRKLEEFAKPSDLVKAADAIGTPPEAPSKPGPKKTVTTITSRHNPPEKKAKPPKRAAEAKPTRCPHGFMLVEGATACPRCAEG